ncbi:MAG: hypothetical protein ACRENL_01555 [Candidatus Dormibacteria bacterium]
MADGSGNILHLDIHDFAAFAVALRRAEPLIGHELTARLRAVGHLVADEAKAISGQFSVQIPPTISVHVQKSVVSVEAGGGGLAIAGLLEVGNQGSRGADSFRHPVFGDKAVIVEQPTHPYLAPALAAKSDAVEAAAQAALDVAVAAAVV